MVKDKSYIQTHMNLSFMLRIIAYVHAFIAYVHACHHFNVWLKRKGPRIIDQKKKKGTKIYSWNFYVFDKQES